MTTTASVSTNTDDGLLAVVRDDHHDLVIGLETINCIAQQLPELSEADVHRRVEKALAYLSGVLRHAHEEEIVLFPLMDGHGHPPTTATAPLHAEHDTLREGVGHLRQLAIRDLTATTRAEMAGLLAGIHLMLTAHFTRERHSYEPLLHDCHPPRDDKARTGQAALGRRSDQYATTPTPTTSGDRAAVSPWPTIRTDTARVASAPFHSEVQP